MQPFILRFYSELHDINSEMCNINVQFWEEKLKLSYKLKTDKICNYIKKKTELKKLNREKKSQNCKKTIVQFFLSRCRNKLSNYYVLMHNAHFSKCSMYFNTYYTLQMVVCYSEQARVILYNSTKMNKFKFTNSHWQCFIMKTEVYLSKIGVKKA